MEFKKKLKSMDMKGMERTYKQRSRIGVETKMERIETEMERNEKDVKRNLKEMKGHLPLQHY